MILTVPVDHEDIDETGDNASQGGSSNGNTPPPGKHGSNLFSDEPEDSETNPDLGKTVCRIEI